jgi:hypothetical protein
LRSTRLVSTNGDYPDGGNGDDYFELYSQDNEGLQEHGLRGVVNDVEVFRFASNSLGTITDMYVGQNENVRAMFFTANTAFSFEAIGNESKGRSINMSCFYDANDYIGIFLLSESITTTSGNSFRIASGDQPTAINIFEAKRDVAGIKLGFFGATPVLRPQITAVGVTAAQLLTALNNLGLVESI